MVDSTRMAPTNATFRSALRTPAGVIVTIPTVGIFLGVVVYAVWILSGSYDPQVEPLVSSLSLILVDIFVATCGVVIASLKGIDTRLRRGWLFLGLSYVCLASSRGLAYYYQSILKIDSFSSPVEVLYSFYYPLALVGLLLFSFVLVAQRERIILWLDLTIVLISFGMAFWFFFLASSVILVEKDPLKLIAIAFPFGDVWFLTSILTLIQRDVKQYARWVLGFLAICMILRTIADSLYAYEVIYGLGYVMPFLNIMWLSAGLSIFAAAGLQVISTQGRLAETTSRFSPSLHLLRLALPYLAVVIGLSLHIVVINSNQNSDPRQNIILYGALGLIALVLLRQYMLLRENVSLYQQMRHIAITDSLTSTYNRHFFNEILPREMDRAKRYNSNLSVLILDIDDFKKYNDTFGHLRADVVLKTLARSFATQLRPYDTLARFGGDEFVIILPETNRHNAQMVAQRIRNSVAAQTFAKVPLSVSIGISSFRPELTPEQFLDEADKDLYQQKAVTKPDQYLYQQKAVANLDRADKDMQRRETITEAEQGQQAQQSGEAPTPQRDVSTAG